MIPEKFCVSFGYLPFFVPSVLPSFFPSSVRSFEYRDREIGRRHLHREHRLLPFAFLRFHPRLHSRHSLALSLPRARLSWPPVEPLIFESREESGRQGQLGRRLGGGPWPGRQAGGRAFAWTWRVWACWSRRFRRWLRASRRITGGSPSPAPPLTNSHVDSSIIRAKNTWSTPILPWDPRLIGRVKWLHGQKIFICCRKRIRVRRPCGFPRARIVKWRWRSRDYPKPRA